MPIDTNAFIVRLLLAAGLSAALGLEREYHRKPAGLRTNMLIGIGSMLFTFVSIQFANARGGSSDRIAAQIVTGIGFLGAGAILRGTRGDQSVHGLTTAATIWVNAAIGMAAGAGLQMAAAVTAGVTLAILVVIRPVERYFDKLASRARNGKFDSGS
jgi:putative Mg2+ transporter-C (MgtC) family protein